MQINGATVQNMPMSGKEGLTKRFEADGVPFARAESDAKVLTPTKDLARPRTSLRTRHACTAYKGGGSLFSSVQLFIRVLRLARSTSYSRRRCDPAVALLLSVLLRTQACHMAKTPSLRLSSAANDACEKALIAHVTHVVGS